MDSVAPSFRCEICGTEHAGLPMDFAYRRPEHFLNVPEAERAQRTTNSDDLCVIDGKLHLLRGVLPIRVLGSDDEFRFGPWALVDRADFNRYVEAWRDGTEEAVAPFAGWLSGELLTYPGSNGLEVTVRLQGRAQRPAFQVRSEEHPLGIDQRHGITMARLHELIGRMSGPR